MLKPTHVSFEYLSDKRAYFAFAGLAIPDVSGIHPVVVKLLFLGWFVGSSDVGRESWHGSGVPTSRTSTDLEGSLSRSYQTCSVFIPDMSDMDDQRPTASFQRS